MHPYRYRNSTNDGYWKNFLSYTGSGPTESCFDMYNMIDLWTRFNLPVVFTESNWTDHTHTISGNKASIANTTESEGTYLVDLFTWMSDHDYESTTGPLRVLVFRGADVNPPDDLGIYTPDGGETAKSVTISTCENDTVRGTHFIGDDMFYLRDYTTVPCYY